MPKKNRFKENRGGRGFGVLDQTDRQFLTPDYDAKRQVGERAVGMFATADKPGVVTNAVLEGADVDDGNFGVDGDESADFRRTSRNDGDNG
jgi:hypothetical protein